MILLRGVCSRLSAAMKSVRFIFHNCCKIGTVPTRWTVARTASATELRNRTINPGCL